MKKFTLFLASLFMTIGAVAQVYLPTETKLTSAELNAKTEPTYIAIKNLSATNNYWFVANTGSAPYSKADFSNEAVFIWEPVAGETGKFYLKKLDGKYMQSSSPKDFGAIENAAKFATTNPTSKGSGSTKFNGDGDSQAYINGNDDANLVRFVTNGSWINVQNGDAGTPKYNTGEGGWTIHYVYAVEEVSDVDITYNYYDGETLIKSVTKKVGVGASFPAVDGVPNYVTTSGVPTGNVTVEGGTFNIQCALNASFPFKGSFGLSTRKGAKWLVANETAQALSTTPLSVFNIDNSASYTWTIEGSWYAGFNFKNEGTNKYLAAPSATPADGNDATLQETVDDLAKFDIVLNGGNYYIKLRGTDNNYVSDFGGNANASLKFWNATSNIGDEGSIFAVRETNPETLLAEFKAGYTSVVGLVGGFDVTAEEINALTLETVSEFLASNEKIALTPGYYFIKATNANKYLTYSNNGLVYSALNAGEKLSAKHVVKFVEDGGNMKLQMTNLGKFVTLEDASVIGGGASKIAADIAGGSTFSIEDKGNAKLLVKGDGKVMRVEASGNVNYWGSDVSFTWYLIPATELEVDLNNVDGTYYATGYYPFAVSADEDTEIFVGDGAPNSGELSMVAVDGVPAETGILLQSTNATTTLKIGGAYTAESSLGGTLTGVAADATEGILVLGLADGALGFYSLKDGVAIGANKGYLSNVTAKSVRLNFGGTTAIDSVETEFDSNAPIFDLSGRRVNAAVKGIYIQNGKKFVVK